MPGSPPCRRAYHERFAPGRLMLTRGCSIPYPSVTSALSLRLPAVSKRARFSGCAITPTNCRAESRGSCVSVSSVITYFTFGSTAVSPTTSEKRSLAPPRRSAVQVRELAALALVTHPYPLLRIPAARTVEEKEGVAGCALLGRVRGRQVLCVQVVDSLPCEPQQGLVLGQRFGGRIPKIGQQAEMQMVVPIGEEPDLQRLDQAFDAFGAGEHRRDHHQRARLRRQPPRKVHSRQGARRHEQRRHPVHHPHGQLAGGQQQRGRRASPAMHRQRHRHVLSSAASP